MEDFDIWNKKKKNIQKRNFLPPMFEEGDIWWGYLGLNIGTEISGKSKSFTRPFLIIKKINKASFLCVPLTTSKFYNDIWHPRLKYEILDLDNNLKDNKLCLNQIKVLDFKRLKVKVGNIGEELVEVLSSLDMLYIKSTNPPKGGLGYTEYMRSGASAGALNNSITDSNNKSRKFHFEIVKRSEETKLARVGIIHTPHGDIATPAFILVGTKATVKALDVEMIKRIGGQAVLANTYHLYLQPGAEIVKAHGGFAKMMGWNSQPLPPHRAPSPREGLNSNASLGEAPRSGEGVVFPTFTDSGGFQVFSLGAAFDTGVSKIATSAKLSEKQKEVVDEKGEKKIKSNKKQMAFIDEDGVTFRSFIDGSLHRFTPERSMEIQHELGADIFFAFDECTSPLAPREYQISAMERTHRWARRCLAHHIELGVSAATGEQQALFAVVQGGAYDDLRKESAVILGQMNVDGIEFDGFGIGGSFTKEDMGNTVKSATENLPEGKPRHLLGIGEPIDFFLGIEYGIDTFDCVSPTRVARHGNIYTPNGRINILNAKYRKDMSQLSEDADSPYFNYTKSYLHHLFKAEEIMAATIASAHNLYFLIKLVENIRQSILDNNFYQFKEAFCSQYYAKEK